MASLHIAPEYGWVILEGALIGLQVMLQGFAIGNVRRRVFNKKFLEEHFPQQLKEGKGLDMGYPDNGSGQLSQKLPFADWLEFNNYQRAHYNYVEGVSTALVLLLSSGLFFPKLAAASGALYIAGRHIYKAGYTKKGPKGRLAGALMIDAALVALFGAACYGSFNFAGGVGGFRKMLGF